MTIDIGGKKKKKEANINFYILIKYDIKHETENHE